MGFSIFAMPSSSLVLLLSVAFGVGNAFPWNGAQPTVSYQADNWSPRPTRVPVNPSKLFKRKSVDVNVCGWIAGKSSEPAVCSSGSSCIHDTIHGYVGCCTTSGACTDGVYTTCLDQNSANWTASPGIVNNGIYTCSASEFCYRNTYPGGYFQYGCGSSNWAAQVATTFSGQATDLLLQLVYTGVNFSPMAAQSSSTSSSSSSATTSATSTTTGGTGTDSAAAVGNKSPATSATSATSTPSASSKSDSGSKATNVGALAGGIGGGLAGLAIISAVIFFLCCRGRRRRRTPISYNREGKSNTTFQPINNYAPEDQFLARNPPPNLNNVFPERYEYAGAAQPDHPYASSAPSTAGLPHHLPPLGTENTPLVSTEIDDFSRGYNNTLNAHPESERDTHIHTGDLPDRNISTTSGVIPIGAPLRGLSLAGNTRTQDRELTSEAFRSVQSSTSGHHQDHEFSRIDDWRTHDDGDDDDDHHLHSQGRSSPEYEDETVPPSDVGDSGQRSPLRETIRANLAAAAAGVMSRVERERDERPRYQLVDEVVGHNVPILHSPGQLRGQKAKRSQ